MRYIFCILTFLLSVITATGIHYFELPFRKGLLVLHSKLPNQLIFGRLFIKVYYFSVDPLSSHSSYEEPAIMDQN